MHLGIMGGIAMIESPVDQRQRSSTIRKGPLRSANANANLHKLVNKHCNEDVQSMCFSRPCR